jgi:hypothetical protein
MPRAKIALVKQIGEATVIKLKFASMFGFLTLAGMAIASPAGATAQYVDARSGTDSASCPVTAPCATLNQALQNAGSGDNIIILVGAQFGPIRLTVPINITGTDPSTHTSIVADSSASVGCVGGAPGSCGANSGYAVEIAAGVNDNVKMGFLAMAAGSSGNGALLFTSGSKLQISHSVFRGNGSAVTPIVALYPNNGTTSQAQVYFSNNDVGFNNGNSTGGGAVEVKPSGDTSLKLHFNHVEVHNANYGIRTDGSQLSSSADVVATVISESEFFSFKNAAMNAYSTSGTGTADAAFDSVRVLNAGVGLKANGSQSFVVITNNTVVGNSTGILISGGATVLTSGNNTIQGNGTNVSGTLTPAALQ